MLLRWGRKPGGRVTEPPPLSSRRKECRPLAGEIHPSTSVLVPPRLKNALRREFNCTLPPPLPPRKRRLYLTALWLTPMFLFSTGEGCWSICACVNRHLFVDTFPFSPLVLNNISLVEILWINIVHTDRLISRINRCVCIVLFFFF